MKYPFSIISIIGRSGAGKGTQAKLLRKEAGFMIIATGSLLRKRAQRKDAVGRIVKKTLERGGLIPTPVVFSLWMPLLEKIKNKRGVKGIIFEGNPRKVYEAQMLNEVFSMFGWQGRFRACNISISPKEAKQRLLGRGRYDDTPKKIAERLAYFSREVEPMIEYYRKKKALIEVNGERPEQEVHKEIMRKLKSFFS